MFERTVIATRIPLLLQALRHLVHVVDLVDGDTLVGEMQDLVVEMRIHVTLPPHDLLDPVITPTWPAVRGEHYLGILTEPIQRLVDLLGPFEGITDERASQCVDIVDSGRDIFRSPECF